MIKGKSIFITALSVFSIIGFIGLYFAIKFSENVPIYGWAVILAFAILPLILIYGFVFGFSISKKQFAEQEKQQEKLSFDDKGITIEMPLFDKSCFIGWQSIEKIIYYNNYVTGNDFTEHYQGFKFHLEVVPKYTKYKKQWWLNRIFSKDPSSKIIDIDNSVKGYEEIPKMIETYLKHKDTQISDRTNEKIIFKK